MSSRFPWLYWQRSQINWHCRGISMGMIYPVSPEAPRKEASLGGEIFPLWAWSTSVVMKTSPLIKWKTKQSDVSSVRKLPSVPSVAPCSVTIKVRAVTLPWHSTLLAGCCHIFVIPFLGFLCHWPRFPRALAGRWHFFTVPVCWGWEPIRCWAVHVYTVEWPKVAQKVSVKVWGLMVRKRGAK